MLGPYFRRHRRKFVAGTLLLLVTNVTMMAIPWLLKLGVDALGAIATDAAAARTLAWAVGGIAVAAVVQALVRIASRYVLFQVGRDVEYELRERAYAHLLTLDGGYFQAQMRGDLVSRLSNDITNVRLLFGFGALNLLNTMIAYVLALTLMAAISWQLTLLALLPYPLMLWVLKRLGIILHKHFLAAQEALGNLTGFLQEALAGYEVVKGFAQEEGFYARFAAGNRANYDANMQLAKTRSLMTPITTFLGGFGALVVLAAGGWFVMRGKISFGSFVAFQGYLGMLVWPTLALGWLFNVLERGLASLGRVQEVLDTQAAIVDSPEARDVRLSGALTVHARDVVVGAAGWPPFALRGLELDVRAGERLAVVGRTGCGKSSLLKLLLRTIVVPRGMVKYDGIDVHDIRLSSLRAQIGYLPQEPFLFGDTVRDALTIGCDVDARDEAALWSVLEAAALADEVRAMPRGLDTRLGERGVSLSGGQRQRLAIARLLLGDPRLLLLDDPLSALDFATAERVRLALERFAVGRTVIWATHRLVQMTWFDRILLLDAGRPFKLGTHAQLMEVPLYRALVERQRLLQVLDCA